MDIKLLKLLLEALEVDDPNPEKHISTIVGKPNIEVYGHYFVDPDQLMTVNFNPDSEKNV